MDGDRFTTDPVTTLNEVEEFLGLPTFFSKEHFDFSGMYVQQTYHLKQKIQMLNVLLIQSSGKKGYPCFKLESDDGCMNKNKGITHPELGQQSLNHLRKHFRPILDTFKGQTGLDVKLS